MTFDLVWTYDGDRDCPGNPGRLFGCRCERHRPDLHRPDLHWPTTAAVPPISFSGFTLPNVNATNILPLSVMVTNTTGAR